MCQCIIIRALKCQFITSEVLSATFEVLQSANVSFDIQGVGCLFLLLISTVSYNTYKKICLQNYSIVQLYLSDPFRLLQSTHVKH